ncbi:uncharacterized protein LOC101845236, partial [Aplysia californica]|uniref:Uncharacterized protein LOC101845236 n=1 Tax=Aplysia californica TaxID=6500 RepID=A0ABM1VST9_APLCA
MDANWVSRKLILAAALFLSSSASVLNITTPEVEVGKTTNVSLGCFNPYPARDISEIAIIRILKWDHDEWNSVAELQRGDGTAVRQKSKDVFVKGNIGSVAESFLRLTWPVATNDTLGQYRCDFISLTFQENVLWQKSLSVFITSTNLTVHVLSEIVEQNKREGFQLLHLQKHDLVENMTATVEDLEADLESQLKYHIRTLSHTVEGNKNESDNQKREILWKMKSSVEKNKKEFLRLLRSQEKDVQENLKTTMEALEAGFQSQIQALSRTMKDNKNECDDQKQKVLEKMTTTVEGIESCFEDKMKSQIKVLTDTVEENKKECPRQLDLHKRQILENVTETVEALEAGLESKMKEQIQVLNHTFEEKRKKDLQQNQIMEKMKAALEESKRECLQQKQDILDNVTATMEALEAGFERKLDDVKSQLQVHMCSDSRGLGPRPVVRLLNGMKVVCDTETDNGGWIVIQRRA